MRKKNFTLVEMLTVIAIIGVLAGILVPTVMVAKRKSQEAKAKTEVSSIIAAIKAYRQQYNKLPTALAVNGAVPTTKDEYEDFMIMLGGNFDSSVAANAALKKANPRKTKFLTPRAKKTVTASGDTWDEAAWLDPWERPYHIIMDDNYDNQTKVNKETLTGDVFVFSIGIDGAFDAAEDNDKGTNRDNVTSWAK